MSIVDRLYKEPGSEEEGHEFEVSSLYPLSSAAYKDRFPYYRVMARSASKPSACFVS